MSDEIIRLKKKIRTIDPLKQKNEIELNVVRQDLKDSLLEYNKSLERHTKLIDRRDSVVNYIQKAYGNANTISVHDMNNVRHYLHELDEDMVQALDELNVKTSRVDGLKEEVTNHQITRKLYDKAQSASEAKLGSELEKQRMNELDDMCSRKLFLE